MNESQEILTCQFEIRNIFPRRILDRQTFLQKIFMSIFFFLLAGSYFYILFTRESTGGVLIMICVGLFIALILNFLSLTSVFTLTKTDLQFKSVFSTKMIKLEHKEIKHFCFYESPVERYGYSNKLVIYLKPIKFGHERATAIRLNFTAEENMKILSNLYRLGFKVLLYDLLLNIEETEFYIP